MGYQNKNFVSQISYLVGVEWISQGSEPASQMRLWLHPKGPAPTALTLALALALAPASIHCEIHKLIMVNSRRYDFNVVVLEIGKMSWKSPGNVLEFEEKMSWKK